MTFTNELEQEDDAEVHGATYQRPAYQGLIYATPSRSTFSFLRILRFCHSS